MPIPPLPAADEIDLAMRLLFLALHAALYIARKLRLWLSARRARLQAEADYREAVAALLEQERQPKAKQDGS